MQSILPNNFGLQWDAIRESVIDATERVGRSGRLILGTEVESFERELSNYWGISFAVGCANGLDAIEIGLRSLEIKPGQKVLTTPLSAFATTLAIFRSGGVPVFCDTDLSGLIDLELVEDVLESDPEIKFLVPVHLFGHALDLRELDRLNKQFELKIVEDCAQSIGSRSFGKPTGSIGHVAATSFYPTKNLGCYGDGGALLTNGELISERARSIRDYGQTEKYLHSLMGLNSRLDELQAAILRTALLPRLDLWTQKRRSIANRYLKELSHPEIVALPLPEGSDSCWHLFPIRVLSDRNSFQVWLSKKGVYTGIHYPTLINEQPIFKNGIASNQYEIKTSLVQAKLITQQEVSLPIHPFLTDSEVSQVIEACNSWRR